LGESRIGERRICESGIGENKVDEIRSCEKRICETRICEMRIGKRRQEDWTVRVYEVERKSIDCGVPQMIGPLFCLRFVTCDLNTLYVQHESFSNK